MRAIQASLRLDSQTPRSFRATQGGIALGFSKLYTLRPAILAATASFSVAFDLFHKGGGQVLLVQPFCTGN